MLMDEYEEYIYQACMDFIKYVLRRKMHHEFGNRELIFYNTGRHLANLYDKIRPDSKHQARYQKKCYLLLQYIQFSKGRQSGLADHAKYLRNTNHIARGKKIPDSLQKLINE
jgi:hypothetical protein